jgi:hypothetical protein
MIPQSPQDPRIIPSPSSSKKKEPSRSSTFREYVLHRWLLGVLAIIMVAIMVVGIIFAAHGYYKALGGQGFLKAKREAASPGQNNGTLAYLPLRKVEVPVKGQTDWSLVGRQKNVPYYICGDQRNGCESFNQPVSILISPARQD